MVLIPPDIGLRMRLQNELLPQPITVTDPPGAVKLSTITFYP